MCVSVCVSCFKCTITRNQNVQIDQIDHKNVQTIRVKMDDKRFSQKKIDEIDGKFISSK